MLRKQLKLFPACLAVHDAGSAAPAGDGAAQTAGQTANAGTQLPDGGSRGNQTGDTKPVVLYGKQPKGDNNPDAGDTSKPNAQQQTSPKTPEQRKAEFSKLISGEYKDEFTEQFQQTFDRRFREHKTTQEKLDALNPLIETLGAKYGVNDGDPQKLVEAFEKDNEFFEKLADEEGMTVEQYKNQLKLRRENASLKAAMKRTSDDQSRQIRNAELRKQGDALKGQYPDFDLMTEVSSSKTGEKFTRLLNSGVDVKTAFEAVHFEEIMSGAITAAGQQAAQNVSSTIQAKGQRPREAGAASTPGVIIKDDVTKYTKDDMAEINRRVARGEQIRL